jgi:hypothetical protein
VTELWQRLKQGKLVQWALGYIAVAVALMDKLGFKGSTP